MATPGVPPIAARVLMEAIIASLKSAVEIVPNSFKTDTRKKLALELVRAHDSAVFAAESQPSSSVRTPAQTYVDTFNGLYAGLARRYTENAIMTVFDVVFNVLHDKVKVEVNPTLDGMDMPLVLITMCTSYLGLRVKELPNTAGNPIDMLRALHAFFFPPHLSLSDNDSVEALNVGASSSLGDVARGFLPSYHDIKAGPFLAGIVGAIATFPFDGYIKYNNTEYRVSREEVVKAYSTLPTPLPDCDGMRILFQSFLRPGWNFTDDNTWHLVLSVTDGTEILVPIRS